MLSSGLLKKRLRLIPPDLSGRRGERRLLVWADVPHWVVVDDWLAAFLEGLDGSRTLEEALGETPSEAPEAERSTPARLRAARGVAEALERRGCLLDAAESRRKWPGFGRPEPAPIETVSVRATRRSNQQSARSYRDCGNGSARAEEPEIGAKDVIALLESARTVLTRNPALVIVGGEPLLRPDFVVDLASYGRKHRFDTILCTNGTLVTRDLALMAARTKLQVEVSLDGPDAPTHDAVHGTGAFEKAVEGVRALVSRRAHTILGCVCHEGNVSGLEGYYELAASLDVDEVRSVPEKMLGRTRSAPLRPVPVTRLLGDIRSLFQRRSEFLRFAGRDAFSALGTVCRESIRRRSCGSGFRTFLIDSDGSLYPCVNSPLPEFRFGNLRDEGFDFERTWRGSSVLAEYRSKTSVDRENGGCAGCPVRYWCLGGCRGETYAAGGRIENRSPECEDRRAAVLEMFWTLSERPGIFREERSYC